MASISMITAAGFAYVPQHLICTSVALRGLATHRCDIHREVPGLVSMRAAVRHCSSQSRPESALLAHGLYCFLALLMHAVVSSQYLLK